MSPDSPDYFELASRLPAPYVTDWRIVLVAPGIVRMTAYERSFDGTTQVLSARGALTISLEAYEQFVHFASDLLERWKEAAGPSAPNFVPPTDGRPN